MVAFGLVRILGRLLPWNRWLEFNDFLDTVLNCGGTVEWRGERVVVEQDLAQLGGRLRAELRRHDHFFETSAGFASRLLCERRCAQQRGGCVSARHWFVRRCRRSQNYKEG